MNDPILVDALSVPRIRNHPCVYPRPSHTTLEENTGSLAFSSRRFFIMRWIAAALDDD
ncbi:MAG: hypothetical protein WCQ91_07520 [Planctomycetota bacterium]